MEFFDYYLLHDINVHSLDVYNTLDCFSWIREKKAQGLVKHIGFSFHDGAALLDRVLTEHPEFEFVQLQINYLDWDSAGVQSRACYEVAEKHLSLIHILREGADKVVRLRELAGVDKLLIRCVFAAPAQVFLDRAGEQLVFLQNHRDRAAQRVEIVAAHIDAADLHAALRHVIQAGDELHLSLIHI